MKAAGHFLAFLSYLMLPGIGLAEKYPEDAFAAWFWHATAAGSVIHFNDEGDPYRFSLGAGHSLFHDNLAFMADLVYACYDVNAVADKHQEENVKGGKSSSLGFDLLLRWNLLSAKKTSVYLEGGAGFQSMLETPTFPADGSHQNFTVFFGPGLQLPLRERSRLTVSLQLFHISNAYLFSSNSGYDGMQLVLGTEWSL